MDVTSLYGRRATQRWERMSVGDLFERVTWSYPDKEAIVAWEGAFAHPENQRVTYRQADELANRVANALLARGLQRGDRVAMFCENSVEAYIFKIGVAKAGLTVVPINPMLAPDVISYLLGRCEPAFAIVDDVLWPKAKGGFGEQGIAPQVTIAIEGGLIDGSVGFADFVEGHATTEPAVEVHADDVWEIIYTSGTTAMPKGAMVTHAYSYLGAYSLALTLTRGLKIECDLKLCSFLPLIFHIADQIFSFPAFLSGGTLVMGRGVDATKIAKAVTQEQATCLWGGSPAMLTDFVAALDREPMTYDVRSLTTTVYGWTAAPPGLIRALKRHCGEDLIACEILGQTEAISCHRFWPDKWTELFHRTAPELNYVGVPNPMVAADVVDEDGMSLRDRPGVPGEVVYRSPVVTAGYYRDEEATREAFRGGWFHSGDVCEYDADGLRIMVDRSKDIVKSGGENVSSQRVESVLVQHPDVQKAAVVGLPHEQWGEAVTAFVIAEPGATPDTDELMVFARQRLAGFESPKMVVVVDELPVTVGGKVLKFKLRAANATLYESTKH
ncbi:AMP-binding protein [Baekduia soli]|uniref:AMP-binding protein n=1 Tax=Baekduia soli TaxID=496014 RepID=A0A5B8U5K1_9ACTN|nr:AMP-binding protein [Baekduia soli]QEC48118.1 AMP-binding protein [Baekduia soli]